MTWEILQSGTSCWQSQHPTLQTCGEAGGGRGAEGQGEEVEVPAAPLLPSSPAPLPQPLRAWTMNLVIWITC